MFILFRQTLVTAVAFASAVTAGQVGAENSFSTVVIDPGHGGSDPDGQLEQHSRRREMDCASHFLD